MATSMTDGDGHPDQEDGVQRPDERVEDPVLHVGREGVQLGRAHGEAAVHVDAGGRGPGHQHGIQWLRPAMKIAPNSDVPKAPPERAEERDGGRARADGVGRARRSGWPGP